MGTVSYTHLDGYKRQLNYLNRFLKEIFAYLDDGELPLDNNLAERTIRKPVSYPHLDVYKRQPEKYPP